jgi:ABC-type lipoprotein release transport system permease subunit
MPCGTINKAYSPQARMPVVPVEQTFLSVRIRSNDFLGAKAFAVLVSLLAGLYPAARAARVDPVKALRHD